MQPRTKLDVARNLVRIYREVLQIPVPTELAALVKRLEMRNDKPSRRSGGSRAPTQIESAIEAGKPPLKPRS
jgi:hypothetical protein